MSVGLGTVETRHRKFCAEDCRRGANEALPGAKKAAENGMESSELRVMHW